MYIQKYVPILRTKRAEHNALKKMESEVLNLITPLYEVRHIKLDEEDELASVKGTLIKFAKNCAQSWNNDKPIIFDTPGLKDGTKIESGENALDFFYSELKAFGLKIIPTVTTDRNSDTCLILKKYSKSFLFRVQSDDLELPAATANIIRDQLSVLKASSINCHIMVDLKYQTDFDANAILDSISSLTDELDASLWKSITFAGCSFPEDMSGLKSYEAVFRPRKNFDCWQLLNNSHLLIGSKLNFADYAIINPLKPEIKGIDPANIYTKIRYTADKEWLIFRGENGHDEREDKYDDYQKLAYSIVNNKHFMGEDFSWGDKCIYECSNGKQRICGLEKWVQIDLNHHITLVSQQVAEILAGLEE